MYQRFVSSFWILLLRNFTRITQTILQKKVMKNLAILKSYSGKKMLTRPVGSGSEPETAVDQVVPSTDTDTLTL
jgi:hypothetical protein